MSVRLRRAEDAHSVSLHHVYDGSRLLGGMWKEVVSCR